MQLQHSFKFQLPMLVEGRGGFGCSKIIDCSEAQTPVLERFCVLSNVVTQPQTARPLGRLSRKQSIDSDSLKGGLNSHGKQESRGGGVCSSRTPLHQMLCGQMSFPATAAGSQLTP